MHKSIVRLIARTDQLETSLIKMRETLKESAPKDFERLITELENVIKQQKRDYKKFTEETNFANLLSYYMSSLAAYGLGRLMIHEAQKGASDEFHSDEAGS